MMAAILIKYENFRDLQIILIYVQYTICKQLLFPPKFIFYAFIYCSI